MADLNKYVVILFLCSSIIGYEAATDFFLNAITSTLATIPLTGGPMTTGLLGAKLGIGAKLLYYLGFFGRSSKKAIPKKAKPAKAASAGASKSSFSGQPIPNGLQAMPLPYVLSAAGRFPSMGGGGFGGFGGGGGGFGGGGGGFGGGGGGFGGGFGGGSGFQQQPPFGGIDPSQVFEALRAQGYDANTAMQLMNYGGGFGFDSGAGFGMNPQGGFSPNMQGFPNVPGGGMTSGFSANPVSPSNIKDHPTQPELSSSDLSGSEGLSNSDHSTSEDDSDEQDGDADDIESFFTFLKDMDDNTCISRLMCDIGSDPSFLGEFSENIHGIVSSLDVQPTSGAYPYLQIMEQGKTGISCGERFTQCSDTAYEIVKNVAPSVGLPQNVNSDVVNRL